MKLIPVLDIKSGQVVAARMGNRSDYAPLTSPLCNSSRLEAVAAGLLTLHPFDTLYIADLDAIGGGADHLDLIRSLHAAYPAIRLWVDSGLAYLEQLQSFARPVVGSESLASAQQLTDLFRNLDAPVLSLDFWGERLLGPAGIDRNPSLWPEDVIVMTLSRVGSDTGPELALIQRLLDSSRDRRLYAAGGIRDLADLYRLRDLGAAGALLSTALHRGRLDRSEIRQLAAA